VYVFYQFSSVDLTYIVVALLFATTKFEYEPTAGGTGKELNRPQFKRGGFFVIMDG